MDSAARKDSLWPLGSFIGCPLHHCIRRSFDPQFRHGVEQHLGVWMASRRQHLVGGADLADPTAIHDSDAVGQLRHHGEIVRDEQIGEPERVAQIGQQIDDGGLHRGVKRGGASLATADLTMGLLTGLAYRLVEADRYARSGHFKREQTLALMGIGCPGKTVGLIGLGKVARYMVPRLRAFDMRILYTKRNRLPAAEKREHGVEWAGLEDLLR